MRSSKNRATCFLIRRNLFVGVAVFLAAFYMMPFWGLSHIPNETAIDPSNFTPETLTALYTRIVSSEVMTEPLNLELMVILYGALGFLTAMMLMRHQFSRRQSMLYAALPDRRGTDFLRRCAAYAALCLVPIAVNFLLYLLVVVLNGLMAYVAWDTLLSKFGVLLLINLYGFAIGMLASVLTGTYWAALLAGAVLIVGAEALAALWYCLAGQYLHTLIKASFRDALIHMSPACSLYKGFYKPDEFVWLPGAAAIVLALALSFVLCRIRRTERAEHTLAFAPLHGILGFALPLLGGTFLGIVVEMSFLTESSLILGMALGAVLTFWLCRIIFNQRLCGILRQWYLPAASAVVLILGVIVLHTDALGYDRFLPKREELTAITYQPRHYFTDETITLTSEEALDAAYEWCRLMHSEVNSYENGMNAGSHRFSGSDVVVTYQMGRRKVIRHYPNDMVRTGAQDALRRVIESDDYRQSMIQAYHLNTGYVRQMHIGTRNVTGQEEFYEQYGTLALINGFSIEDDAKLLDQALAALKEDILNRTFEEKQEDEILSVSFYIRNPDTALDQYRQMSIYPGDTNFLSVVFGEKAEAAIEYAAGGFARSEDIAVLKVDYAQTFGEIRRSSAKLRDILEAVALAADAEEAAQWLRHTQDTSAESYYFKPSLDDTAYSRVLVYRLSEAEKYGEMYDVEIAEDPAEFYRDSQIPVMMTLEYTGEK